MTSARNPTRRNRNIGTAKRGHGQDNKLRIPESRHDDHVVFWERLGPHKVVTRKIRGKSFHFLVETTRADSLHPCTVDDLARVIEQIPPSDLESLDLFVLRQPKRKEQILSSVWGRLVYFADFGKLSGPAIILESLNPSRVSKWPRSLKPEQAEELERLRQDGHAIIETKREFIFEQTLESARTTQLYRTLLHEIGHWVDYLEKVERPAEQRQDEVDAFTSLNDLYFARSSQECECFAHSYAEIMAERLRSSGIIPFERQVAAESLERDGLSLADFVIAKD